MGRRAHPRARAMSGRRESRARGPRRFRPRARRLRLRLGARRRSAPRRPRRQPRTMFPTDPLSLDPSFPQMRQLRDVDINRASADARLSAALRRRGPSPPGLSDSSARCAGAGSSSLKITPLPAARTTRLGGGAHAPSTRASGTRRCLCRQRTGAGGRVRGAAASRPAARAATGVHGGHRARPWRPRPAAGARWRCCARWRLYSRGQCPSACAAEGARSTRRRTDVPRRVRADVADPDVSHFSKNDGDES